MSPVNDQYNIFYPPVLRKLVDDALIVNQTKVRRDLADLNAIQIYGGQPFTVQRTQRRRLRC